jgi:tetratricopeptide (TPR) repeat protein
MDALLCDQGRLHSCKPTSANPDQRDQALELHRNGHIDHAIEFYKAWLKRHPRDSGIWSNLGACLRERKHHQAALACYYRALHLDSRNGAALCNLANVLKDLNRLDESLVLQQQLTQARPNDVQTRINHASALREHRQFDAALQQLEFAQSIEPDNPAVRWERAQNLLHAGRYSEGLAAYEARWELGELPCPPINCPRWQGEALQGKRIFLHAEQGYGDTILAARYIRRVKEQGAYVILQCKPELHRLFANIGADQLLGIDQVCKSADYHCPLMSLLAIFNTQLNTIAPPARLSASLAAKRKFDYLLKEQGRYLNVAIVWSGSLTFKNNYNRSAGLEHFLSLADLENVRLFSLQKGPRAQELYANGADAIIDNLADHCTDFADTAAALEHMDVVVMTDSSVAHLAGSLGKPVINLLQYLPYWIYSSHATTTPWYPSHRLVKQTTPGDWNHVFAEAKIILQRMSMEKAIQRSDARSINDH